MRVFKLSFLFLFAALFIAGCNKSDITDRVYNPQNQPYEIGRAEGGFLADDELVGPESLDLQAIGSLLERANNAEDFEYLLNSEEGINNFDLNDDGYADYISVREFGDGYDDERGFSLFSMFGPELIQEVAQIFFDRDGYNDGYYYPGSRVLIRGNDYLYGDDYYYETDWMDRRVPFVDWIFSDRDYVYSSPYYYQNYPSYYQPYTIVETPVYLTRIEQYYYSPVFVYTTQPTVTQIEVVSPYQEVSLSRAYMTVPEPQLVERRQKVQVERTTQRARYEREKPAKLKEMQAREDRQMPGGGNPNRAEKRDRIQEKLDRFQEKRERSQNDRPQQMREMREKPGRPDRVEQPRQQQKSEREAQRVERQQQQRESRQQQQQQRFERQAPRVERQQPQQQRIERPQPQQQQRIERQSQRPQQVNQPRPQRQEVRVQPNNGGGNPNKGGGNPNNGGGNPNAGGKGKGKP